MQTTDAGLVVPNGTVPKKARRLPPGTVRRIRQFMVTMHAEGLNTLLVCRDCSKPVEVSVVDRIDREQRGGRLSIGCQCSIREEAR